MRVLGAAIGVLAFASVSVAEERSPEVGRLLDAADMVLVTVEMCAGSLSDAEQAAARLQVLDAISSVAMPRERAAEWFRLIVQDAEMLRDDIVTDECAPLLQDAVAEMEQAAHSVRRSWAPVRR
ncbi:hypothetical protein ACTZWW_04095 [Salinarimonas sp. NSM]|uniref:hypothetical protein n=1 Tax=Salinarimonas sp. NSM TaxID=3458003 RepID=UPI0040358086